MTTNWTTPDQPSMRVQEEQARWLAPLRTRLLRQANVAQRLNVVDLGCGAGVVTRELTRRAKGKVWAVDRNSRIQDAPSGQYGQAERLVAMSDALPFPELAVDMVFCQFALMWMPLHETIEEIWRMLTPGGVLIAIEPDYASGVVEYPPEIAVGDLWLSGLKAAGANVDAGRRLPGLLQRRGFEVKVDLLSGMRAPSMQRFESLLELPLDDEGKRRVANAERLAKNLRGPWEQVLHLPIFGITATKPDVG